METTGTLVGSAEALARSAVYRLLSRGFTYPTVEGVAELCDEDLPLAVAVADPLPEEVRLALSAVGEELDGAEASKLEEAYREVFSHVHSADCPVYETDYTARDVWRQTRELADIAGFYRAFGMDPRAERPDHVAVELEFLHLVSYKVAWAAANDDEEHASICADAEQRFAADHTSNWIPGFAARVTAISPRGFYRRLGELALALMRAEASRLGIAINETAAPVPPRSEEELAAEDIALCEEGP
ncbi:MAG TPA: molecular chaperone TorD family protein [Actinomycetota bacterium]|nr:molecular chaperone TorD family protein [Actinomycetota bacterium]